MSSERWSIVIDIEGFRTLWEREDEVLWALGDLMLAIYRVGSRCYHESRECIFAHQIGDGFIIVSDYPESSLVRPVAIAIALMRHVAARGRFARAGIAEGQLADIVGCYPKEVRDAMGSDCRVFMRRGLMTVFPVMGTALIRAVRVADREPSGSLILLPDAYRERLSESLLRTTRQAEDMLCVDWVHADIPLVGEIQQTAELRRPTPGALESALRTYCTRDDVPVHWRESTLTLLSIQ